jgi:hypothetical protein
MKMEAAVGSSETSVGTYKITRRHIPQESDIHDHRRENLKFRKENVRYPSV